MTELEDEATVLQPEVRPFGSTETMKHFLTKRDLSAIGDKQPAETMEQG